MPHPVFMVVQGVLAQVVHRRKRVDAVDLSPIFVCGEGHSDGCYLQQVLQESQHHETTTERTQNTLDIDSSHLTPRGTPPHEVARCQQKAGIIDTRLIVDHS